MPFEREESWAERPRQCVYVRLEFEAVDRIDRLGAELGYQVDLDLGLLFPRRIGSPIPLPERKIAVPDEPLERNGTLQKLAVRELARVLSDLISECGLGCTLCHLRSQAEPDGNDTGSDVFGLGIDDLFPVVPVPPFSLEDDPSQLLRFAHKTTRFCEGTKQRLPPF
jgi:hypothetical protein